MNMEAVIGLALQVCEGNTATALDIAANRVRQILAVARGACLDAILAINRDEERSPFAIPKKNLSYR